MPSKEGLERDSAALEFTTALDSVIQLVKQSGWVLTWLWLAERHGYSQASLLSKLDRAIANACRAHMG